MIGPIKLSAAAGTIRGETSTVSVALNGGPGDAAAGWGGNVSMSGGVALKDFWLLVVVM